MALRIQNKKPVEQLIDVGIGLVDIYYHQPTFQCLLLKQEHDFFGTHGGKTGGGFIHKQYSRFPDQFKGNIEPFTLAPTDEFLQRIAHFQVLDVFQVQVRKHLVHSTHKLSFR